MERHSPRGRDTLVLGSVLVIAGVALLVGQQLSLTVDWLTWPIIGGVVIFAVAVVIGGETGSGFAALGGIVTMAGVVMAVQRETGAYASWAYAWALVAPGGVGLGLAGYGALTGRWELARGGLGAMIAGLVIFLMGLLFFEGVLGLSGAPDPQVVGLLIPVVIIGLGGLVLLGAVIGPRIVHRPEWTASVVGSPAGPPVGATGDAETEPQSIDLGDAPSADIAIAFGAGNLTIVGAAAPGHLVDGAFRGGVRREDGGPGRVKLSTPGERIWQLPWDRAPFDWRIGLTAEVPMRLSLETGAARTQADLSGLKVAELRVRTGAADTSIHLPAAGGHTRVDAQGGAAALRFRVPPGVAARIHSTMALGSTDIDTTRFPRDPLGGWASPDFATAEHRVELELSGGVGSVAVR